MMNEIGKGVCFALLGAGIGSLYFGGLWWTVRRLPRSGRPQLLALGSFLARAGLALAGLMFVARSGRWQDLAAAFLGLMAVRWILLGRWGLGRGGKIPSKGSRYEYQP
ncbi:MAG TPA: ATP synthase subunit I [Candidatus Aminicenantes bacterium]|nr:ATP synthase subunit I [Candidatus Aminicenantes bacterium]HDT13093.1 ATP synthase subunit I [Candidatus Aminicenantes bacterium]